MRLFHFALHVLFVFAFSTVVFADETPIRWDDFVTSGTNAVLGQSLITPISRQSRDFTEVKSKQNSYTIGVDEVLYIPVWNETPEGAQIGISWRVENMSPEIVSSVMVKDYHPTHRSNQLSPNFTSSNTAPFFLTPPVPLIGCETRHGVSTSNVVRDNIVLGSKPTAFICIQGRSIGQSVILVGERASTINRQEYYGLTSTGPNLSHDSSYVNPNLSLEINVNVVAEATSKPDVLAHVSMTFGFKQLLIRPINDSFELLPCKELRVLVDAGKSLRLQQTNLSNCFYTLEEIEAPNRYFPPYFDNAQIYVLVEQDIEAISGNSAAQIVRTATAFAHVIPSVGTGSNLTAWAMLSCPTVVYPGVRFGCEMRLADTTGTNPSDNDSRIAITSMPTSGPYTYLGRPIGKSSIVCFEVEATAENQNSFAISGITVPGFRFRSQQIWIDERSEHMIIVPHRDDCRNAQLL